jgi:hypothetical protein
MLFAFLVLKGLLLLRWTTEMAVPVPGRSSKDDF